MERRLDETEVSDEEVRRGVSPHDLTKEHFVKKNFLKEHAAGLWNGAPRDWSRCMWSSVRSPYAAADGHDNLPTKNKSVKKKLKGIVGNGLHWNVMRLQAPRIEDGEGRDCYRATCTWNGPGGDNRSETYEVLAESETKANDLAAVEAVYRNELVKEVALMCFERDYMERTRYVGYENPLPSDPVQHASFLGLSPTGAEPVPHSMREKLYKSFKVV